MLDIELEKQRCSQDFIYFVETYCKVQSSNKLCGKLSLNVTQKRYFKDFQSNKFNLILKQRQVGASTLLCMYAIWNILFCEKYQNIIFVSVGRSMSKHLRDIIINFLDNLPKEFFNVLPVVSSGFILFENDVCVRFDESSSEFLFVNNSKEQTLVIFDEAFFMYKSLIRLFYAYNAIKNSNVIIISTRNDTNYEMKISRMFFDALFYMLNNKEK